MRIGAAERHDPRIVDAGEPRPGDDGLAVHPSAGALQMRPDRELLGPDRAEVDVTAFRRDRSVTAFDFDQRSDAEARSRPENDLRARGRRRRAGRWGATILRNGRQHQRLRLEVVEQEPLREARAARRLGAVHHQGALVSFKVRPATGPAPQAIRARALAELRRRRPDRLGQAGIIVGDEMDGGPERPAGLCRPARTAHWCRRCRKREPGRERRCRSSTDKRKSDRQGKRAQRPWDSLLSRGEKNRGELGCPDLVSLMKSLDLNCLRHKRACLERNTGISFAQNR